VYQTYSKAWFQSDDDDDDESPNPIICKVESIKLLLPPLSELACWGFGEFRKAIEVSDTEVVLWDSLHDIDLGFKSTISAVAHDPL
jgi:hypothetical protein